MDLLLLGERSLSPRAYRALSQQNQENPQIFPRPQRLLDYVCELALRLHPEIVADVLSPVEVRDILRASSAESSDSEIDARIKGVEKLRPLGLGFDDARELLLHLENNQRLEMSLESQSLLDSLSLRGAAHASIKAESRWEIFQRFVEQVKSSGTPLPTLNDGRLLVPTHRDFYPLEVSFLKLVSSQIQKMTASEIAALKNPLIERSSTPLFVRADDRDIDGTSFAIQDLPFLGWLSSDVYLLGERASFKADYQPLFAAGFAHWLEVQSYILPKLPREEMRLQEFLGNRSDTAGIDAPKAEIFFYPEDFGGDSLKWNEALQVPDAPLKKTFSPSALESYAECPRRYYLSRLIEPKPLRDDDLGDPDFLKRGEWLHACLEEFFKRNQWDSIDAASQLRAGIGTVFGTTITPLYRQSLETEATILGERLDRHLREFELPLHQRFSQRRLQLEEALKAEIEGQSLYGKIDRIDDLGQNLFLIWDYKSGETTGAPATQIKNGKFQWFLYKEIFEKQKPGATVLGGGYLNPLDPEKSSLFLFRSGPGGAALDFLEAHFAEQQHPFHVIHADKSDDLHAQLNTQLQTIVQGLRARDFAATPRKDSSCDRCDVVALCGRPYLRGSPHDSA